MQTKGSIALAEGKTEEARKYYQTCLSRDPHNPHHIANYATTLYLTAQQSRGEIPPGIVNDATELYKKTLKIYPQNIVAWLNLAHIYEQAHKLQEAIACYKTIIAIQDPTRPHLPPFALVKIAELELKHNKTIKNKREKEEGKEKNNA